LRPFGLDDAPAGKNSPGRTTLGRAYSGGSAVRLRGQWTGARQHEEAIPQGGQHLSMISPMIDASRMVKYVVYNALRVCRILQLGVQLLLVLHGR
jgi:hypothetical protein